MKMAEPIVVSPIKKVLEVNYMMQHIIVHFHVIKNVQRQTNCYILSNFCDSLEKLVL